MDRARTLMPVSMFLSLLLLPPGNLHAQSSEAAETADPAPVEAGDPVQAIVAARRTLQLYPNAPTTFETRARLALLLYQTGDVDGAIEEYRAILALHAEGAQAPHATEPSEGPEPPDLAQVHVDLASALMAKQEWRAAQAELTEALRLRPELVQAHTSLGAVRYTLGDVAGAIQSYEEALKLRPEFADAHYRLGLLLKVTRRETEAVREFHEAAAKGLPKAQYFLGTAYAYGLGVERDPAAGLGWWLRAAEQGSVEAGEALVQWRRVALGKAKRPPAEGQAAREALEEVRRRMWQEYPGLEGPPTEEGPGSDLLARGREAEAIPALIREAATLSTSAQLTLERLYDEGVESRLASHDPRILRYFTWAAAEGLPRPRLALARIYARGAGVPKDRAKALALLQAHPDEEGRRLLADLAAEPSPQSDEFPRPGP
jgi:TPR repeat protein